MNDISETIEILNELLRQRDAVIHRLELIKTNAVENVDTGIIHHINQVLHTTDLTLQNYTTSSDGIGMMYREIHQLEQIIKYFDTKYPQPPAPPQE